MHTKHSVSPVRSELHSAGHSHLSHAGLIARCFNKVRRDRVVRRIGIRENVIANDHRISTLNQFYEVMHLFNTCCIVPIFSVALAIFRRVRSSKRNRDGGK